MAPLGTPAPDTEAYDTLLADYRHTAFALYHAAATEPGNVVVAPHTNATALAMLYTGARGASAAQLARALGWRLPAAPLAAAARLTRAELMRRVPGDTNTTLQLAGRLWAAVDVEIPDAYQDLVKESFGAGVGRSDFAGDPAAARATINDWVADTTQGLIPELLTAGAIGPRTRLVQTSAMYLQANWQFPMEASDAGAVFYNADASTSVVTMLNSRAGAKHRYAALPEYVAVEVHYEGMALAMDIIMPEAPLAEFEPRWQAETLTQMADALVGRDVVLHVPKFSIESSQDLAASLKSLGVHDLFDPHRADLSTLAPQERLRLDAALSRAKIAIDENGTEAATATAIVVTTTSAESGEPVELTIDRPFLFVIRDVAQNLVLLMGRVDHL